MGFKLKNILCISVILFISSCGDYKKNFLEYRAEFNPEKVEKVEQVIIEFADENKLRVFNKDKKEMSILSKGENAFYIALYYKGDPFLSITNVGVVVQLSVSSIDYGNISKSELSRLTLALIDDLQRELNLEFKKERSIQ